jgi:hypothetical protein
MTEPMFPAGRAARSMVGDVVLGQPRFGSPAMAQLSEALGTPVAAAQRRSRGKAKRPLRL